MTAQTILMPDICVIGAGAAGLSVAASAAAFGVPTVLVDAGAFGGECLHTGCVPSKALLAAAEAAETLRGVTPFGLVAPKPRIDMARVRRHVEEVQAAIGPNDSAERFAAMGVRVVKARARFVDRRTVEAGDVRIRARRVVVATGSAPRRLDLPGLSETPHWTTDTVWSFADRPERLLVIGGGAAGLELAQAFRRLGSEVTVVDAGPLLGGIDPEIAAVVLRALRREGVVLRGVTPVTRVDATAQGIRLELGAGETLYGSHLLVAAGREPRLDDLGLEAAGIARGPDGIAVDGGLRTRNRRVYAVGDCVGGPAGRGRSTTLANHHAAIVTQALLFRRGATVEPDLVPRAIFTAPEIATVGLDEAAARAAGKDVRVLRWPFSENDRAQAERATQGLIKVVTDRKGAILGVAIVGASAGELIAPWVLALRQRLPLSAMRDLILPYPTLSEASRRAAITFYADWTRKPWVGRVLRFLRLFG